MGSEVRWYHIWNFIPVFYKNEPIVVLSNESNESFNTFDKLTNQTLQVSFVLEIQCLDFKCSIHLTMYNLLVVLGSSALYSTKSPIATRPGLCRSLIFLPDRNFRWGVYDVRKTIPIEKLNLLHLLQI